MATKKPAKPKASPKPTVTQAPITQKKKSIPTPLLVVGGSMSLGSCALACLCLLMRRGGSKSSGVPNVLGLRVPANAKPSGLPATMLSGILLSVCVGTLASIIFMVLTKQRRMTNAARAELYGKMFEAVRRLTAAEEARRLRFEKQAQKEQRIIEQNRRTAAANAWIFKPFNVPLYDKVPRFVLLGKVLGEYATFNEAKTACNTTQHATHIQVDTKTGRAVVKTIMELPEGFGTETSTAATLTTRCGEGFHKYMDTYVHPRFYLLNAATKMITRDWVDITHIDLLNTQSAQERKKAQMNDGCFLGNSGTCKWESKWKDILFNLALPITFAVFDLIVIVLTAGMGWFSYVIDAAVLGVELGVTMAVPTELSKDQAREAKALEERLKMLKTGEGLISNAYAGGKNSYWGLFNRLTLPECSKVEKGVKWGLYTNKALYNGFMPADVAGYQLKLLETLDRYEKLPVDFWNCDEITGLLEISGRFQIYPTSTIHEKGPTACADADAAFNF